MGGRPYVKPTLRPSSVRWRVYDLAMTDRPTALERAFQLARSGDYANLSALKDQLRLEGHPTNQIEGATLMKQLRDLLKASRDTPELAGVQSNAGSSLKKP